MDCRTCKHNTYKDIATAWVHCVHPISVRKSPRYEKGDPAFVSNMSSDIPISRIAELGECPTFEAR
jgi:hypothetical protein